jgi:hypothetical protein
MGVSACEGDRSLRIVAGLGEAGLRDLLGGTVAGDPVALAGGTSAVYMNDIKHLLVSLWPAPTNFEPSAAPAHSSSLCRPPPPRPATEARRLFMISLLMIIIMIIMLIADEVSSDAA